MNFASHAQNGTKSKPGVATYPSRAFYYSLRSLDLLARDFTIPPFPTPPHTHTHTHGDRVGEDPRNEVETESGQVGIAKNIFASN